MEMLKKVLIANRGEIAVRIARGCRELGVATVAVFSEVDAGAPHTLAADEAICIGPAAPNESYLDVGKLIDAARTSGADAVHPGYGFLSERAAFAAAVRDAGLVFVGPSAETIEALGDKQRARALAEQAGVPVTPGAALEDDAQLPELAQRIGFPLLLKAASGGGGKGMRVVRSAEGLDEALGSARREALTAFGDDRIIVEKLIERPRHVEIQILCDQHGAAVHLLERECSVQRRHQKIIEEAPSVAVDAALRARMGDAALRIARAANYHNAGTVELMLAEDGHFYFLEVNTRLQVEHPVTEAITGVDLVHEQLRVASGERLALSQGDIAPRGHAIECRVYAEDPERDFAPSPGPVLALSEPQMPGVRVDSGIRHGQTIPLNYDPILAKVIAHAPTRDAALARARRAMAEYVLLGFPHNVPFLDAVLAHPAFVAGELHTGFIAEHWPDGFRGATASERELALAAALLDGPARGRSAATGGSAAGDTPSAAPSPWQSLGSWRQR
ncbi:MAG: acetyl-CoA carboxylase biotin carboxylase subunit [Myxococcales bacterium]|nr:acetyl-CoA carboxylase biotin carboxylase subunit [Myxococcales bacterium]